MSSNRRGSRIFRRAAVSAIVGLLLVGSMASAALANVGTVTISNQRPASLDTAPLSVTMYKEICPSYSDVPANDNPGGYDDTGGHSGELNPGYKTKPVTPLNSLPAACHAAAGWEFQFKNGQSGSVIRTSITGTDGTVTVDLNATELALARTGVGLWVLEVMQPSAPFGQIRCYNDMYNGDNLENIQYVASNIARVYCFAYNVANPQLTLTKTANSSTYDHAGQVITYTYLVTNTGNVTINSLAVTDNKLGTISCPATTLAPAASVTCHATYTVTLDDIDHDRPIANTATATGTSTVGTLTQATGSASVSATQSPALTLTKTANSSTYDHAGQVITYTYTLHNGGNVTLTSPFTVTDVPLGPITCAGTTLAPGHTTTCSTTTYTTTQADLDAGTTISNTATGHAHFGETTIDSSTVKVDVAPTQNRLLTVTKTPSRTIYDAAGQVITYTYTLHNGGNVTLTGPFSVTDVPLGTINCTGTTLAPGATTTCDSATYTTTQDDLDAGTTITNTATGHAHFGETAIDSSTVTVNVTPAQNRLLTVTTTPSRTIYDAAGQVITYTYTLHNGGNVVLAGPFSVTDVPLGTINCTGTTLAPGADLACDSATYTTTQDDLDAGTTITNTATGHAHFGETSIDSAPVIVTVSTTIHPAFEVKKTASTTGYAAVGDVINYSYELTNTGNTTLDGPFTVGDNKATVACPNTDTLAPGAHITCTASYTVTQADLDARSVTNTATGHASFHEQQVDSKETSLTVGAQATPSPFESFEGGTGTGAPQGTATPPATNGSENPPSNGNTPLFALLICLAFEGLALLTVEMQRRSIRR